MSTDDSIHTVAATATGSASPDNDLVCRSAFALLLSSHQPVPIAGIVAHTGGTREWVDAAIRSFQDDGAIDIDIEGRVEGVAGLSVRPSIHDLRIGDDLWHTWCALDASGIPVALDTDAEVVTTCPTCARRLSVSVRGGHVAGIDGPDALWLPSAQCGPHLIDDFCSAASLFCGHDHLTQWAKEVGACGAPANLGEVEEIGRVMWQRFNVTA